MEHTAHPDAPAWAAALENSAISFFIRDSTWLYPLANLAHIYGLALVLGSIIALDLRLLGVGRRVVTAEALSRFLAPVMVVGLALSITSGLILFTADASAIAVNPIFRLKMVLLVLGLANAWAFRRLWTPALPGWDIRAPLGGRLQAAGSMVIWLLLATAGRLIAYF